MRRHLMACPERQAVIAAAEQGPGRTETLFHLQVEDAWRGDYWLHLEMRGSATLDTLDRYLRAIWLECCGHLSRFSIRGWGSPDIPMSRRAKEVFAPGRTFIHQYDFGTTSETRIKVLSSRQGKPTTGHPIALMARNVPPEIPCIECGRPARWLCVECLVVEGVFGALCDEHATTHPHKEYGEPLPLVNSPRMGMCGYRGPAEPPY
ncbi:MAG TPA: plasmid pRiA4b ORF-3 family protein [Thermoflexia bacterium]|nr:plasmid pRiA4b ORF-3 family protein [Thermoflexia bacterium]